MPNYLVRLIKNHEAVGIFAVEDFDELLFWVDECTDPQLCEYAEIGSGSILWEGKARKIPDPDYDWEGAHSGMLNAVGKQSLGGLWASALVDGGLIFTPLMEEALTDAANDA